MRKASVALALAMSLCAEDGFAQAGGAIALTWHAAQGCPGGDAVLGEIHRLLGGAPEGPPRLHADALARPEGRRWLLTLKLRDEAGEGERQLEGDSCQEIADAAALVVALAFDPDAVAATQRGETPEPRAVPVPPEPAPVPLPQPPAVAAPVPRAPVRPGIPDGVAVPPPPEPDPLRWLVEARASLDLGSLPSPAFGIGGSLGLRWDPVVLRVDGAYFLGAVDGVEARPTAGGRFTLWFLGPGACWTPWHSDVLHVDACGGVELGQLSGTGFGVKNPSSGSAFWLAPRLSAELAIGLTRYLGVSLSAGAGVPVFRPDFVLNDVGIVHTAFPVIGRGGASLWVAF